MTRRRSNVKCGRCRIHTLSRRIHCTALIDNKIDLVHKYLYGMHFSYSSRAVILVRIMYMQLPRTLPRTLASATSRVAPPHPPSPPSLPSAMSIAAMISLVVASVRVGRDRARAVTFCSSYSLTYSGRFSSEWTRPRESRRRVPRGSDWVA